MRHPLFLACTFFAMSTLTFAQTTDSATSHYFDTIKDDPQQLLIFLQDMPKGGDLHNHLSGATMAENMMRYAHGDHMCVDPKNKSVAGDTSCSTENLLDNTPQTAAAYNAIIDAWSMRNFHPATESGHDHFFATFNKYMPIATKHSGEVLAEVVARAGDQNENYLELMVTPDNNASGMLSEKMGWDPNFATLRYKLITGGIDKIIADMSKNLDADEAVLHKSLACGTNTAKPGCKIKIRYLYQVLREQPPAQVFGQLVAGFEAASKDPRIVGINMVQPEDGFISMRDYKLHMQMVGFLHGIYPHVHISLHAGELNSTLVPTDGLRFHIREAIETAHADRIGHGVDIAHESQADQLLKEMAKNRNMVEINLTSNAEILGVKGKNHPLPLYMHYNVPVSLSTDDEGVLRTDLTQQYLAAVTTYHFSYSTLKMFARNSITYSFLPGLSLWQDAGYNKVTAECGKDVLGSMKPTVTCQMFLTANEKARMQWDLENRFAEFESKKAI